MERFLNAFKAAVEAEGMTLKGWAKQHGIVYSTLHTTVSGRAPNSNLFRAMCTKWPDAETGLLILRAHLEDEIERAGRSIDEITPVITGTQADPTLEENLALIKSELPGNPDFRAYMDIFAGLIREKHKDGDEIEIAPEVENPYPPDWDKVKGTDEDSKRA